MASKWAVYIASGSLVALTGCYEREDPEGVLSGGTESGGDETDGSSDGKDTDGAGEDGPDSADDGSTGGGDDTDDPSGDDGDTGADANALEGLIGTLCEWDFKCCSEGEIDYRLGPFTTDEADCTERFIEQLHSNDNEAAETPRGDLLYVLGFAVRLDRSEPNAQAVNDCRDLLEGRGCNEPWDEHWYCEPTDDPADSPCDLRNMFTGKQKIGDPCSGALASLGYDIECEAGSSCEEMDGTFICVDKGLDGDFCEAHHTCDQGLFCDISTGRCAPRRDIGQACAFKDPEAPDAGSETVPCREHLSCDPSSNTCVQYCSLGYDCVVDEQCAEGHSCIPVDMGDNTYTYCLPRGNVNGDRCDSERDCADAFHCNNGACAADRAQGLSCTADNQCQAGLYCDLGGTGQCELVNNANAPCTADRECNPNTTLGCMTSDDGSRCRTALLDNGDACVPGERAGTIHGNWCRSGVCEDTSSDGIYNPVCHVGASVGQECDESDATDDVDRCAVGLYCHEGVCKTKLDSGGDCEEDQGLQCLNGSCVQIWQGDYCTDATPMGDLSVATCDGID